MTTFINETTLEFSDISSEEYRIYTFPSGAKVRIEKPLNLHVGLNGHRLYSENGESHYVPNGWIHLQWKAKDGKPNFVK